MIDLGVGVRCNQCGFEMHAVHEACPRCLCRLWADEQLPHLRTDAPPKLRCTVCHRLSWSDAPPGTPCDIVQPRGPRCVGMMVRPV